MVEPATLALIASALSALGSIGGGILGSGGSKETPIQKQQRKTIDEVLRSLQGEGAYSDLFDLNEEAFQRSYVDPALSRFQNQIAPGIQQKFIQSGLQRGTGLDTALTQAGIDMNQLLNEQFLNYLEGVQGRRAGALSNVLGQPAGAAPAPSFGQRAGQATAGYLSSDAFSESLKNLFKYLPDQSQQGRPGFGAG